MNQQAEDTEIYPLQPNGMIIRLPNVTPEYRSWSEAVKTGAPETKKDSTVNLISHLFECRACASYARLLLMWAGKESRVSSEVALEWGRENGLRQTHPFEIFALSAAHPRMFERFGLSSAGLAATLPVENEEGIFICGVWQSIQGPRRAQRVAVHMDFFDRTIFVFAEP